MGGESREVSEGKIMTAKVKSLDCIPCMIQNHWSFMKKEVTRSNLRVSWASSLWLLCVELTVGTRLQEGRPLRIFRGSSLEIMVAIQVLRRGKCWYILKVKPTGLADGLHVRMMERKEGQPLRFLIEQLSTRQHLSLKEEGMSLRREIMNSVLHL